MKLDMQKFAMGMVAAGKSTPSSERTRAGLLAAMGGTSMAPIFTGQRTRFKAERDEAIRQRDCLATILRDIVGTGEGSGDTIQRVMEAMEMSEEHRNEIAEIIERANCGS
jgi:hypothetical protein